MDAILKNNFKNILAGYELVKDYTVSGSAITSYDFTGLNITKEDDYMLVSTIIPKGSSYGQWPNVNLYANSNYTNSNYYSQKLNAYSTTISAGRDNLPNLSLIHYSGTNATSIITNIKLTNNNYFVYQSNSNIVIASSSMEMYNRNGTSTFTASSITSLRISTDVSNAIAVGSRFQLYKRVAPIVYDYTVSGSAITSLDITGLSIDKGSEYMLVSTYKNNNSATSASIYFNNNYTATNYYYQRIYAEITSVGGVRGNSSLIANSYVSGSTTLFIANIKLTNNGYLVWQSNNELGVGSNEPIIWNAYGTSNFTDTSITSIRIASDLSNQIGAGSRFQLIKLK